MDARPREIHKMRFIKPYPDKDKKNVSNRNASAVKTELHLAVEKGNVKTVRFLLAAKAKMDVQDEEGNTPLNIACKFDKNTYLPKLDIISLLLAAGANPILENNKGENTLSRLISFRDSEEIRLRPHLIKTVQGIIQKIKRFILETAKANEVSVFIKETGQLVWGDGEELYKNINLAEAKPAVISLKTSASKP